MLPGELTGTSAGIGRCQLHLVGVGIGFSNGVEVRSPPTTKLPLVPPWLELLARCYCEWHAALAPTAERVVLRPDI